MTEGIKCVVRGTLDRGGEFRNIFYYTGAGDFTSTTITNWVTGLYGTLASYVHSPTAIYGVDVAVRLAGHADTDPLGWGASEFIGVAVTFSGSGDGLPPADSMVVIGRTGVKHVMARKFIPGAIESAQNQGELVAGAVTALTNFANYWKTPTADPLGSGSTANAWGPVHGFTPITSVKIDKEIYHLRSRQPGRGV